MSRRRSVFALSLIALLALVAVLLEYAWPGGRHNPRWVDISEGLPRYGVTTALAFDAADDKLIYAGIYYEHGLYRSTDGGQTWHEADQGLAGAVFALAASPTRPGTVYAGAIDGVYQSTDGAQSWRRLAGPEKPVYALFIPHQTPDLLYAGSFDELLVSRDAGATWLSYTSGLEGVTLLSFAAVPDDPEAFYAGTGGGGLLQTVDGGVSWKRLFASKQVIAAVVAQPQNGRILLRAENRMFRSTDGGKNWQDYGPLPGGRRPLCLLNWSSAGILAGSEGDGVYLSRDDGQTWLPLGEGLGRGRVTALAISPVNPQVLVAGTPHGVYVSRDGGLHWASGSGAGRPIVRGLILTADGGRLLAGTTDGVYERSGGVWHPLGQMKDETLVLSLAVPAGTPATLYAGTWGASVQKSTDGGESWQLSAGQQYSQTIIPALVIDPQNERRLFARVEYDRLIVTDDEGTTWRPSDVGLMGVTVFAVAAARDQPGLFYVGTDKGVYRSVDDGESWTSAGTVPWTGSALALNIDPQNADDLQVGTTNGLYQSRDGGQTWLQAAGLQDVTVVSLVFSAHDRRLGFAGTRFHGVYETRDEGITWHPLGEALSEATANALAFDEKGRHLYAGTEEGVFALDLDDGH